MMRGGNDRGYAMLAVVAGIGVMAAVAAGAAASTAARLDTLEAETTNARLSAAADAGVEIALANLTRPGLADALVDRRAHLQRDLQPGSRRDPHRGRGGQDHDQPHRRREHRLADDIARPGGRPKVDVLRDSFDELGFDANDFPRANGAEGRAYFPGGYGARNGPPQSVEELGDIRGFTPALVDRIARIATVEVNGAAFDKRYADSSRSRR
jgi:type II secretory pathway component PulK